MWFVFVLICTPEFTAVSSAVVLTKEMAATTTISNEFEKFLSSAQSLMTTLQGLGLSGTIENASDPKPNHDQDATFLDLASGSAPLFFVHDSIDSIMTAIGVVGTAFLMAMFYILQQFVTGESANKTNDAWISENLVRNDREALLDILRQDMKKIKSLSGSQGIHRWTSMKMQTLKMFIKRDPSITKNPNLLLDIVTDIRSLEENILTNSALRDIDIDGMTIDFLLYSMEPVFGPIERKIMDAYVEKYILAATTPTDSPTDPKIKYNLNWNAAKKLMDALCDAPRMLVHPTDVTIGSTTFELGSELDIYRLWPAVNDLLNPVVANEQFGLTVKPLVDVTEAFWMHTYLWATENRASRKVWREKDGIVTLIDADNTPMNIGYISNALRTDSFENLNRAVEFMHLACSKTANHYNICARVAMEIRGSDWSREEAAERATRQVAQIFETDRKKFPNIMWALANVREEGFHLDVFANPTPVKAAVTAEVNPPLAEDSGKAVADIARALTKKIMTDGVNAAMLGLVTPPR